MSSKAERYHDQFKKCKCDICMIERIHANLNTAMQLKAEIAADVALLDIRRASNYLPYRDQFLSYKETQLCCVILPRQLKPTEAMCDAAALVYCIIEDIMGRDK